MKLTRLLLIGFAATLVIACEAPPPEEDTLAEQLGEMMEAAPEPPALDQVAPEAATTIDRNQWVSVVHVTLAPEQRIPEHDAPVSAVYFLTGADLEMATAETSDTASHQAGEAAVWEAGSYSLANIGETEAEMVVVVRTAEALPEALEAPAETPASEPDPAPLETVITDDDFIVHRLTVEAGQERRVSFEYPCSVYTVTPATLQVPRGEDETETMEVFEDRAVWFDWQSDFTVQGGDEPTELAVFQVVQ